MSFDDLDNDLNESEEHRPPLYLVTGLVLGILLGLFISRVLSPVRYIDTSPAWLSTAYKAQYRLLVAQAYQANGNLERARQRLQLLGEGSGIENLSIQAQQWLADGNNLEEARVLAALAADLMKTSLPAEPAVTETTQALPLASVSAEIPTLEVGQVIFTPTPSPAPSSTPTPWPTFTPRPSPTLRPSPQVPFVLKEQRQVCDAATPGGLLQIVISDASGKPLPGIAITLTWENGQEVFYTGLYPSISLGYANVQLTPGVVYSVRPGEAGESVRNLEVPECKTSDGQTYPGGWWLEFTQR